ncbi:MarR family winged helix-turn-helix transcriptional regulator [Paracidobacterium acidisoli]|uniref:MarR family transcriptional regulator n=1 Tax=Paracidobacterium acidisoli TaxID=2303751 RepID=A0A372IPR8_9BACT|nr:MarR family winged helix-turn-helix transcriptional regulator [Paracidobacterium acidisoli]MBT9331228.1 MarR family winged helix-turn-helix transcriptional regulator [Paracidobacterium acidisoli]
MDLARPPKGAFSALLLAQIGAHAAKKFAERLAPLKLAPAHAGILRRLSLSSALSQRELAAQLGMHASRLVGVIDEMQSMGLVVREGNTGDRRTNSLRLTDQGNEMLGQIRIISQQHNEDLCSALNEEERVTLTSLLQRIADQQGLIRGVHPGYKTLGSRNAGDPGAPRRRQP